MSNRVPGATLQMRLPPGSNRTPSHALTEHFSLAKKKSLSHGSPTQDQRKLNPGKTHRSHLVNSTVILSAAKRSKKTWRDLQETPPPRSGRARRFALSLRRPLPSQAVNAIWMEQRKHFHILAACVEKQTSHLRRSAPSWN